MFDVARLLLAVDSSQVRQGRDELSRFTAAGERAAESTGKFESGLGRVRNVLAALALGATITQVVKLADSMSLADARLANVTKSSEDFAQSQNSIYQIANRTNTGIEEQTVLFTKLAEPVQRMGGNISSVTKIVDAFSASLRVGGANTQEAASATLQFAQAMGSGKLQGDEFRSIAEASPRFMKALADGMHVPIEQLKKMGSEGKLTADVVGNALVYSLAQLRTELARMPDTAGGAWTRLVNDVKIAIRDVNKDADFTSGIIAGIEFVRSMIPGLKSVIIDAFQSASKWIDANREGLAEAWENAKAVGAAAWEIAKAVAGVFGWVSQLAVQSGALNAVWVGIRYAIAAVEDGVTFLGAGAAKLGSMLLQFVVAPLVRAAEVAGAFVGLFDPEKAAQLKSFAASISEYAKSGSEYAESVFARFAAGESAVGKLGESLRKAQADSEAMKAALASGGVSAADNAREMSRLARGTGDVGEGFKKLTSNVAANADEMENSEKAARGLRASIAANVDELKQEASGAGKLNEAQKARAKLMSELSTKYKGLTTATFLQIDADLDEWDTLLKKADARKQENELIDETLKARAELARAAEKEGDSIRQLLDQQNEENDKLRYTGEELRALEARRLSEALAIARQVVQRDTLLGYCNAETQAHIDTLQALEDLQAARNEGVHLRAAREASDAWRGVASDLSEWIVDGAEFSAERVRAIFKNMVLRPAVEMGISQIGSLFGLSTGGGAKSSPLTDMLGLGNLLSGSSIGAALFGNSAAYGAAIGTTSIGAGSQAAMLAAQTGEFGLAGLTATSSAAAGAGAGASSMAATAGPYALAALAAYAAYDLLVTKETPHRGGYASADPSGRVSSIMMERGGQLDPGMQTTVEEFAKASAALLNDTAKKFGTELNATVEAVVESDRKDGSWGFFRALVNGQALPGGFVAQGSYDKDPAKAFVQFTDQAAGAIRDTLVTLDIAGWMRESLNALGDDPTFIGLSDAIDKINATDAALSAMVESLSSYGGVFLQLGTLSSDARFRLAELAGGVEAFTQKVTGYIANYFSDTERMAISGKAVLDELAKVGISFGAAGERGDLRAVIDSLDLSTEMGAVQLNALLDVQANFATVGDYLKSQGLTLEELAAQAPQTALLEELKTPTEITADATTRTADAAEATHQAVVALTESLIAQNAKLSESMEEQARIIRNWDGLGMPEVR